MTTNTFYTQLTLEGLDGSVQVEPCGATGTDALGHYLTFLSTNNNFVVAKTDSYITDLLKVDYTNDGSHHPANTTRLLLYVNGRDTGISYVLAAVDSAINNRMPSKPGIGEGASIQFIEA